MKRECLAGTVLAPRSESMGRKRGRGGGGDWKAKEVERDGVGQWKGRELEGGEGGATRRERGDGRGEGKS